MSVPHELRILYIRSAPDKLASLEHLWAAAEAGYWQPDAIAPLRELAHRLAGSGGSYGFTTLGDVARELELSLDDTRKAHAAPATVRKNYETLREELKTLAHTAMD